MKALHIKIQDRYKHNRPNNKLIKIMNKRNCIISIK